MKKVTLSSVLSKGNFLGDLNNVINLGTYLVLSGSTNLPSGVAGGTLSVSVPKGTVNRITQLITSYASPYETYIRIKASDTVWGAWVKL